MGTISSNSTSVAIRPAKNSMLRPPNIPLRRESLRPRDDLQFEGLGLAGIDERRPIPQGGAIEQHDGRLTGSLAETGRDRLKAVLPEPTD